jgi:hypothetical protein
VEVTNFAAPVTPVSWEEEKLLFGMMVGFVVDPICSLVVELIIIRLQSNKQRRYVSLVVVVVS